jgi:dnd system-associated protein 4
MRKNVNQKELFSGEHTIYWPDRYEAVVEYLKNGNANKENPNSLYKLNVHVIVLAACLGVVSGERLPFVEKEKKNEIPLSVFNNHDLSIFIYLVSLLSKSEPDIDLLKDLDGENKAVKVFEEYAAAGLQILSEKYKQGSIDIPFMFVTDLFNNSLKNTSGNDIELPPEEEINLFN